MARPVRSVDIRVTESLFCPKDAACAIFERLYGFTCRMFFGLRRARTVIRSRAFAFTLSVSISVPSWPGMARKLVTGDRG